MAVIASALVVDREMAPRADASDVARVPAPVELEECVHHEELIGVRAAEPELAEGALPIAIGGFANLDSRWRMEQ